jgi:hypothetical protein
MAFLRSESKYRRSCVSESHKTDDNVNVAFTSVHLQQPPAGSLLQTETALSCRVIAIKLASSAFSEQAVHRSN